MELRNIEAERSRMGITQNELCVQLGVSVKTLNNYVSGRTAIPSDVLIKLCEIFGCSADYILGRSKKQQEREAFTHPAQPIELFTF